MERWKSFFRGESMRDAWRWLAALFFVFAGVNHFLHPHFYERIVPPGFPSPKILVIVSGLAEIVYAVHGEGQSRLTDTWGTQSCQPELGS